AVGARGTDLPAMSTIVVALARDARRRAAAQHRAGADARAAGHAGASDADLARRADVSTRSAPVLSAGVDDPAPHDHAPAAAELHAGVGSGAVGDVGQAVLCRGQLAGRAIAVVA